MGLKREYTTTILIAAAAPLALVAVLSLNQMRSDAHKQALEQLHVVAESRQALLTQGLEDLQQDLGALASMNTIHAAIICDDDAEHVRATEILLRYQEAMWGRLHHVFVVDADGKVVISPGRDGGESSHTDEEITHPDLAKALAGASTITDFFGFSEKDHYHQLGMAPVISPDGVVVGAVIAEIVIASQLASLNETIGDSDHLTVHMVTPDGQEIVHAKGEENHFAQIDLLEAARAQGSATSEYTNAAGKVVVSVALYDNNYPWIIFAEMDKETIFAPAAIAMRNTAFVIIGSLLLLVVASMMLARRLVAPLLRITERADAISKGDFSGAELAITTKNEIGRLSQSINTMAGPLRRLVQEVTSSVAEFTTSSGTISESSDQLVNGIENQQRQTGQVSAAAEEMAASIREVASKATDVAEMSVRAGEAAEEGGEVVSRTIEGMNAISQQVNESAIAVGELGKRGEQIGAIIAVINDIADQTNLLALNAAIEAARAGEHGRGFAVVADEVRKLAERTTAATEEVAGSIKAIQDETMRAVERMESGTARVDEGVALANQAGESLSRIVESSRSVAGMIQSIAAAAQEQDAASNEISRSIEAISTETKNSADSVQQTASAATQLSTKSAQLRELIDTFTI